MKALCKHLSALLLFSCAAILSAQNTIVKNAKLTGSGNEVPVGSTLTVNGTLTIAGTLSGVYTTDTELTALKNLTATANYVPMWDSSSTAVNLSVTPVSQALVALTTAAAWRNAIFPTTAAEGDLITHDGTNWIRKAIGTTGQVLTAQADGTFAWADFAPTYAAEDISYDNASSGLAATDVQDAIDELDTEKSAAFSSSAALAALLSDESGSGAALFATSPAFTTNFTLANGSSPTTSSVAQTAFDTDAWAASRGAVQVYDGTANTYVVAPLASDTPTNGQVPTWNSGGTITWETPSAGGGSALFVGRSAKAANYTVVAGDKGYVIDCVNNAFTISFTAAATLGDGFFVAVFNSGGGLITLDPNGSETIRDRVSAATTKTLQQGEVMILFCNGSGFLAVTQTTIADVVGPASSTDNRLALFSGTTGKLLKDGATLTASSNTLTASSVLTLAGTDIVLSPSSNRTRTDKPILYGANSTTWNAGSEPAGMMATRNGVTGFYSHAAASNTEYHSYVTGGTTSSISATAANQKASFLMSVWTSGSTFAIPAKIELITKVAPTGADNETQIDLYATPSGTATAVNATSITGNGILTRVPVVARTTALTVTDAQSSTYFTNEGATAQVVFTLPTAAAHRRYTFIVQDTDGLRVTAASGDTIRIAGTVTAAAGYVEASTIGNTVELVSINATEWIATSVNGTWTFGP